MRPAGRRRLACSCRVGACRRKPSSAPTPTTRRKEFLDGQPTNPRPRPNQAAKHRPGTAPRHPGWPRRAAGTPGRPQPPAAMSSATGPRPDRQRLRRRPSRPPPPRPHPPRRVRPHPPRGRAGRRPGRRAGLRPAQPHLRRPADRSDRIGHRDVDVAQREHALALGVRVAVHDSRQNDRSPHVWQTGQDYRVADAIHAARRDLVRARHGPERVGPER